MSNAGGVVGAHMLSSKDGNRVKGTVSPGGREREIKVHSLMLDVHCEIKHLIGLKRFYLFDTEVSRSNLGSLWSSGNKPIQQEYLSALA